MFGKKKAPYVAGGKIDNSLGPNTSCHGTIKSDGNLRLDGLFEGHIETAGNVIIGTSAQVRADVVAHAVQVWGTVYGNITAQGRLEILPGGQVYGDVHTNSLTIDGGGILRGQCFVTTGNDIQPPKLALPNGLSASPQGIPRLAAGDTPIAQPETVETRKPRAARSRKSRPRSSETNVAPPEAEPPLS